MGKRVADQLEEPRAVEVQRSNATARLGTLYKILCVVLFICWFSATVYIKKNCFVVAFHIVPFKIDCFKLKKYTTLLHIVVCSFFFNCYCYFKSTIEESITKQKQNSDSKLTKTTSPRKHCYLLYVLLLVVEYIYSMLLSHKKTKKKIVARLGKK